MKVRLTSAMPTYDVKTGNYMVQLNFGEVIKNEPQIAARLPSSGVDSSSLSEVAVNKLILIVNLEEAKYFRVGSTWELEIKESGVSLKPADERG
ncbi:hypothetical protein [Sulfolobus sp. E11-6]|uniref:hypothetical protein n=1 Tax=Sulfolobus sp. E11-6 TaxID=2663020 RepID=UPI0012968D2A|nr:hypothetical protein [Sulfolobus sp. E11-6]QGA68917.1 hypothetical protein GFS33_09475 [Sulfolobus sp. E11-6]